MVTYTKTSSNRRKTPVNKVYALTTIPLKPRRKWQGKEGAGGGGGGGDLESTGKHGSLAAVPHQTVGEVCDILSPNCLTREEHEMPWLSNNCQWSGEV